MAAFMTNLLEAVHRENIPRVKALLSRGDDVNTADAQGVTPLMVACERGELEMVNLLLEAKASTKCVTNDTQSTCLHFAARTQSAEVVRRILQVDPTIQERAATQGDTALMLACLSAKETEATAATLAAMLESPSPSKARAQGSDVDSSGGGGGGSKFHLGPDDLRLRASNRHGHTALHCAAFASSPTAVGMLLEAGADCTMGDKAGRTAFDVAMNLAGKKTPVREAGRGGSTPAAECLRLLRDRWRQLEREARDKEMRLLGELDAGPEEDRGVGGKGRRGGGGARESVSNGGRKGSRKKKKKNQPQQHQQRHRERSAPAGGGDRAQIPAPSVANKDAESPPADGSGVMGEPWSLGVDGVATSRDADEGVGVGMNVDAGVSSKDGVVGKRESSDSEGETDDEAGSHPSSDADNGSHEDPVDRIDVAAAVVVAVESEETVAGVVEETASPADENSAVDRNQTSRGLLDDAEATDGEGAGSEGSWSVVGPKARKKKAASPPLRLQPPPPSSRHHPRSVTPPSESGSSRTREAFGVARVSRPTSPRIADFPPLPGGVGSSRGARGVVASGGRAAGPTAAPAMTRVHRAAGSVFQRAPAAKAALVPPPSAPGASAATPADKTAAVVEPSPSADVVAPVVEMPKSVTPALVGAADNADATKASFEAVTAVAPKEQGPKVGARVNGGGTGSNPAVKRQLNVNANAWTPSTLQEQRQYHDTRPPPPPPLQQQMQHMSVPMPIRMHHVPPPPQQQQQQQPIPFTGVPMGSGVLRHQPSHPLQHAHSHPPHPAVWTGGAGGGGQQLPYNIAGHTGAVSGSGPAVGFGAGFCEMRQPSPIQMVPVVAGVGGALPGSLAPPPQMVPTPQDINGVIISSGVGGDVGCVPGTEKPSPKLTGEDARADGAQEMLDASSTEAAALALKVEHLVWSVESMSAGLSMGQLDTLKAFLLDQAARVDEAKLEQVRAQERSKNEEKANIQQLHHTQGGVPDSLPAATVTVTTDSTEATDAAASPSVAANCAGGESAGDGECVDAVAPGGSLDKNNSPRAGGSNVLTAPSKGKEVAVTGGAGVESSREHSGGVGVGKDVSVCSGEKLESVRGGVRECGEAVVAAVLVVKPQLGKREGDEALSSRVAEELAPPGRQETR